MFCLRGASCHSFTSSSTLAILSPCGGSCSSTTSSTFRTSFSRSEQLRSPSAHDGEKRGAVAVSPAAGVPVTMQDSVTTGTQQQRQRTDSRCWSTVSSGAGVSSETGAVYSSIAAAISAMTCGTGPQSVPRNGRECSLEAHAESLPRFLI